jgi:hypothetical protein
MSLSFFCSVRLVFPALLHDHHGVEGFNGAVNGKLPLEILAKRAAPK